MDSKMKKQSMGRQKIEIKKIEEKTKLQVAFSKRRKGLFKKVAEFSTLCGADAAVLVHSPGGKLFSFGHPSPDHVISRYLGFSNLNNGDHGDHKSEEVEKECKNDDEGEEGEGGLFWWRGKKVEELGLEELEEMKRSLEGVKRRVMARREEMDMEMIMEIPRLEDDDDFLGFCS